MKIRLLIYRRLRHKVKRWASEAFLKKVEREEIPVSYMAGTDFS